MAAALYKQIKDVEMSGSEAINAHLLNLGLYTGGPSLRTWDTCLNPRPPTGNPVRESIRRQRSLVDLPARFVAVHLTSLNAVGLAERHSA